MTNDKDPFDGYGYAIRTFWFACEEFKVFRGWGRERLSDKYETALTKQIHGIGTAERDSIRIIGTDTKTKQFDLNIRSDATAADDWKFTKDTTISDEQAQDSKLTRHFELIRKYCDDTPPTASLGYTEADWEIGITSGWWSEILVPVFVLDQLENDISSGMVEKIHFGVEWICGLVFDKHAPPAASNTWGLIHEADNSPEVMKGYVRSIRWNLVKKTVEKFLPSAEDPKTNKENPMAETLASTLALSQAITALSNRVNVAFTIVAAIIIFAYLLR